MILSYVILSRTIKSVGSIAIIVADHFSPLSRANSPKYFP